MTNTRSFLSWLLICLIMALPAAASLQAQSALRSGPMIGHVDMRSASIFLQTMKSSMVSIRYVDSAYGKSYSTPAMRSAVRFRR